MAETTGNFEVGFGRPPRHSQFVKGKSGNPKGRPKGARGVGAILNELIQERVPVTGRNGRRRWMPVLEIALRRLVTGAMRDAKALKELLSLVDRYGYAGEAPVPFDEMLAEDKAILARYLPLKAKRPKPKNKK